MKAITALLLCFATAVCLADDANTSGKKAEKKAKPAAKSDKNFAQRAESSTGKFLRDNKIWTKSESRGTGTSDKKAKKTN